MRWKNRGGVSGIVKLPAEGYDGEIPAWPITSQEVADTETGLWQELWRTPQALMWRESGYDRVVARYVTLYCLALVEPKAGYLAELRQLEDRLGLSPLGLKRLGWEIDFPATDHDTTTDKGGRWGHLRAQDPEETDSETTLEQFGERFRGF